MGSKKRVVAKAKSKSPAVKRKEPVATKSVAKKAPAKKPPAKKPPAKKPTAKKFAAKKPAAKKPAAKKPAAKKPKTSAAGSLRAALSHLELLCSAHPGLVLEGDERATFARECPPLAPLVADRSAGAELLVYCTWALRKMGRFREAVAAGERAVAVERSWRTLTAKASVHRANDQPDLAVPLFEEAARLDPSDTAALMEGARTLGEAGRFVDAAQWFGRVVKRDPERTDARVWAAYSAFCGSKDLAHVKVVRDIIRDDPDDDLAKRLFAEMTAS